MKQVVQNYKSGELAVLDVPVPGCKPGGVLVRTAYSLISTGTELMKVVRGRHVDAGQGPLPAGPGGQGHAERRHQRGPLATYRKVMGNRWTPTRRWATRCAGWSSRSAPVSHDVTVGDLVACAGNEHALHAELNWVPRNLYAPVPDGVAPRHAAFGTVGVDRDAGRPPGRAAARRAWRWSSGSG